MDVAKMQPIFASTHALSLDEIEDSAANQQYHPPATPDESDDYVDYATELSSESVSWQKKYMKTLEKSDIYKAISTSEAAIRAMKPDTPGKGFIFSNLSTSLYVKFRITCHLCDIDEAIAYGLKALDNHTQFCETWRKVQLNVTIYMIDRFDLFPCEKHIREALEYQTNHTSMKGLDNIGRSRFLSLFGVNLSRKYELSNDPQDLNKALERGFQSIENLPSQELAEMEYSNLATTLFIHYKRSRQFSSLKEALIMSQAAINFEQNVDFVEHATVWFNHGIMLEAKSQRYRDTDFGVALKAMDAAIDAGEKSIDIIRHSEGNAERTTAFELHRKCHFLSTVGVWYGGKMKLTGEISHGQEGLKLMKEALQLIEMDHQEDPRILTYITHVLDVQHQILEARGDRATSLQHLNEALEYGTKAANMTPEPDQERGERCLNLAKTHLTKYGLDTQDDHMTRAKDGFCYVAKLKTAHILSRIPASIQGALLCLKTGEIERADELVQSGISLLPIFNPRSLSTEDLRATLNQVSGLSSFADEYNNIRAELSDISFHLNLHGASQHARARQESLLRELAANEDEVRKLAEFKSFQLPPEKEEVQSLAKDGPLIAINVTQIRSDAIIVTSKDVKSVKLSALTFQDLQEKIAALRNLGNESRRNAIPRRSSEKKKSLKALRWLWDVAVRPILDVTELTPSRRVWWVTSGLAGQLPLHAAGNHAKGSTENTLSRVISSYVSSINALRISRENASSLNPRRSMLLVTMRNNPSPHRDLSTEHEEKVVKSIFGDNLKYLPHPDPETVLKNLPFHSFIHFACHGCSIAYDPSQSGLLLVKNDKAVMLTVADLEMINVEKGAVAYLSACSTAEQSDGKLEDEAIHLANTFQALGFQHVIGTMWGADDRVAGEVAKGFYEKLALNGSGLLGGDVAKALHDTMVECKEAAREDKTNFLSWGPFIHIGS